MMRKEKMRKFLVKFMIRGNLSPQTVVVLRNTWFIESPVNCVQKVYNFTTVKLIDRAIIDSWSISGLPTTPLVINIMPWQSIILRVTRT